MIRIVLRRLHRHLALAFVAGATVLAVACEDPFDLEAQRETDPMHFEVWSVNGSPDEFPSALRIDISGGLLVRPEASGNFDVAFDIDGDGKLLVIPMRLVVTPIFGARDVKFIQTTAALEQVQSAPLTGWQQDSTIAVDVGETFLVRVYSQSCVYQLRQFVYAKLVVDSILPAERRARLRGRLNPNCGFRSFQEGLPEF